MKPKSDLVALSELGSAMAANQFASLEIEQDTGSTSHANTESIDVIELDGVVRAGSLNSVAAEFAQPGCWRSVVSRGLSAALLSSVSAPLTCLCTRDAFLRRSC